MVSSGADSVTHCPLAVDDTDGGVQEAGGCQWLPLVPGRGCHVTKGPEQCQDPVLLLGRQEWRLSPTVGTERREAEARARVGPPLREWEKGCVWKQENWSPGSAWWQSPIQPQFLHLENGSCKAHTR